MRRAGSHVRGGMLLEVSKLHLFWRFVEGAAFPCSQLGDRASEQGAGAGSWPGAARPTSTTPTTPAPGLVKTLGSCGKLGGAAGRQQAPARGGRGSAGHCRVAQGSVVTAECFSLWFPNLPVTSREKRRHTKTSVNSVGPHEAHGAVPASTQRSARRSRRAMPFPRFPRASLPSVGGTGGVPQREDGMG